jgi:hypothetical protein
MKSYPRLSQVNRVPTAKLLGVNVAAAIALLPMRLAAFEPRNRLVGWSTAIATRTLRRPRSLGVMQKRWRKI